MHKSNYSMKLKNDLADTSLNCKKWWGIVNTLSERTGHSEIPAIEHSDIVLHNSKRESQHLLSNLCRKMQARRWASPTPRGYSAPSSLAGQSSLQPKGITKILRRLKPGKASGPDLVPSRVLKNAVQNLLVHYAVSFNSASLTVLSRTNGRLPLSSQSTREIPRLIQLSTGQFLC